MTCNLALILLREAILQAGQGNEFIRLAWYRRLHRIPASTFYRFLNNLIDEGFLVRVKRDHYVLNPSFVNRMLSDLYTEPEKASEQWDKVRLLG